MSLAFDGLDALFVLRWARLNRKRLDIRCSSGVPDAGEGHHVTRRKISGLLAMHGISGLMGRHPLSVATNDPAVRTRTRELACHVHSEPWASRAFVRIGRGLVIASPELIFLEMGSKMTLQAQVMLGMELCGSYARDPRNPRMGDVTRGVPPATSVARILKFARRARYIPGLAQSLRALKLVCENSWSPMESAVATTLVLPCDELGYGMGPVELNGRVSTPGGELETRVPDITIRGTHVGINYDGEDHFMTKGTLESARRAFRGDVEAAVVTERRLGDIRRKVVDDKRRDRDLMLRDFRVVPMVKEDLSPDRYERIMRELAEAAAREDGVVPLFMTEEYSTPVARAKRMNLLRSLMPAPDAAAADARTRSDRLGSINSRVIDCEFDF